MPESEPAFERLNRLTRSDRLSMAPFAALMYAVAGLLVAGSLLLPKAPGLFWPGILGLGFAGVAFGAAIWVVRERLPLWFFQISTAAGSVIVALCVYWSGDSDSPYAFLLVWVAVFSAYFFTTRQIVGQMTFAALAYAAALALHPQSETDAFSHWLLTIAALAVVAAMVATLVRATRRLEAERSRLLEETMVLARTDPLTGMLNRRAWDESLEREMARSVRGDASLCVALLDLDHFKRFNDEHGHPAGDRLLQELSVRWSDAIRPGDALGRYGGEEFAVLLPECEIDAALEVVERLRRVVHRGQRCSAGVVEWDGAESPSELVSRADVLLYAAKQGGRDRVALESAPGTPSRGSGPGQRR